MIDIINYIISSVGSLLTTFINLLPASPFHFALNIDSQWLQWMNYLFPLMQAIAILENYVVAVATYYAIRIVLRWIKVASS